MTDYKHSKLDILVMIAIISGAFWAIYLENFEWLVACCTFGVLHGRLMEQYKLIHYLEEEVEELHEESNWTTEIATEPYAVSDSKDRDYLKVKT